MGRSSRERALSREDDRKKDKRLERSRKDERNSRHESNRLDDNDDSNSYPPRTHKGDKREKEHDKERNDERKKRNLSDDDNDRHVRESKWYRRERDEEDDGRHRKHHRRSSSRHRRHDSDDSDNSNTKKRKRDHDRRDKKKSSRHKKVKKHSKHDKEEKSNDDQKTSNSQSTSTKKIVVDKKNLYPLGDVLGHKPDRMLNPEQDYFEFHQHFWLYLYREQHVAFNDLTTDQARKCFKEFTKQYNDGKLERAYYDVKGPPHEALNEIKTTGYKWGFQISDRESKNLQTLHQGIQKLTDYSTEKPTIESRKPINKDSATNLQSEEDEMQQKLDSRKDSYQLQKKHLQTIDEVTGGRPDGRERLIEKRKEIGAKTHGAARDREEAASAPILSDDAIYGGSERDFESALAAQKRRKMQQDEQKQQRVAELQAKEDEKKKAMLQLLGLSDKIKPGEKIQIKPRDDP